MPLNNILIIKLGALGDVVQALGPMKAIRAHHPDAHITILTTKAFAGLIHATGYANDVWIDKRPRWHDIKGWFELNRRLNEGRFTRVYDLQNNDRTALYFRLLSPKPEWVGVAKGASHRNTSPARTAGQAFDGHVQTLGLAGITNVKVDPMEWVQSNIARFAISSPYVLIVPGSSPKRPEKRWPAASYAALCQRIAEDGMTPVLLGTADEATITATIAMACPAARDLAGQTTLFDIAVLARGAAGAVGNDTGPMHLIAPTGCPALVLFSKYSNPVRHAPKGPALVTLQSSLLDDISVDDVMKKFKPLMR